MDVLTIISVVLAVIAIALALYVLAALGLFKAAYRLAAQQEQIPPSLDCRDRRHAACVGCSCSCHT